MTFHFLRLSIRFFLFKSYCLTILLEQLQFSFVKEFSFWCLVLIHNYFRTITLQQQSFDDSNRRIGEILQLLTNKTENIVDLEKLLPLPFLDSEAFLLFCKISFSTPQSPRQAKAGKAELERL